jgi:hypothetical protein
LESFGIEEEVREGGGSIERGGIDREGGHRQRWGVPKKRYCGCSVDDSPDAGDNARA